MIGQTISHYRILEKLGRGGMGVVYQAEDVRLHRHVALKFLPEGGAAGSTALRRFEREAQAASALNHPNICTIYEVEEHNGQPVIVMELLEGESLKERICKSPMSTDEVLEFGIQSSEALAAAHAKGIIHRDIKPGNIFIVSGGRVKILDFGLAKVIPSHVPENQADEESLTVEGVIPGTTAYMSPEQVRGEEIDACSDLFSLGVVLYEMATTKRPFVGKNRVQLMNAILNNQPVQPSSMNRTLPVSFDTIIAKVLEKDRASRYQHAADLGADLKRLKREIESGQTAGARAVAAERGKHGPAGSTVVLSAGVLAIAIAGIFFYSHRTKVLTEKDTVVLADFTNRTGEPVFDGTLRQGLAVQLEQSPFLSIVSEQHIQQTLRLMGQPSDAKLTPEIARDLCQRTGSFAALDGSIASLGSQYVLGVKAVNCRTGETLAEDQVQAARKEDVLNSLSGASAKLREKLGESLSTVQKFDTPLEQATTPSLESLQAYSLGRKANAEGDETAALPLFQQAIRLDPNFAMAYAALGTSYFNLGEYSLGAQWSRKAYELRGRVSEREKFYIDSHYYYLATGDLEKACQTYKLWEQTYPRDDASPRELGVTYAVLGQYEKALAAYREALRLNPASSLNYDNLVDGYRYLNRLKVARSTAEEALANKLDSPILRASLYQLAFLQNDAAGMAEQVAWSAAKPGVEDVMLASEASTAAYYGHLGKAREFSRRAVASAEQAEERETAAGYEADAALREALFGNPPQARERAAAALALSTGRDAQYGASLALAFAGDAIRAQELANDLAQRSPEDTVVHFNYLPTIHAQLALSRNDFAKAVEAIHDAAPYELGTAGQGAFTPAMYPVYVRGETYLAAHRGSEAAAEFQKILEHRSLVLNEPIGPLSHLGLARAYALQGETPKARAAYRDFLELWKDADIDIAILKQAKEEYARLQ